MIPNHYELTPCEHGCGVRVLITITDHGRRLAVNPHPDPAGNTAIWRAAPGGWRSRALHGEDAMPVQQYEERVVPHVATSPDCSPRQRQAPLPGLTLYIPRPRRRTRLPRRDRR
ncbi:hypothetical protein [Sphaerisporangium sp. NPDC051011]|uniref:hypothetical protein n=1 Tax=Sphaerisporangium sp. NPDC051011 TaxID=3155792 RepID=UPI0033F73288